MPEHWYRLRYLLKLKCCFTSTENVGLLGTGAQDGHLDLHTAPELCALFVKPLQNIYRLPLFPPQSASKNSSLEKPSVG